MTATVQSPVEVPQRSRPSIGMAALFVAMAILLICCGVREFESLRNLGDTGPTVGTWIASAIDAEHGIIYRPLVSDAGYGGTRYAPLRSLIQAGLLKANLFDPMGSAMFVSAMSTALLLVGCYVLMGRFGLPPPIAVAMTGLMLASNGVRVSILAGMADPLAAALSIWGLVAIMSSGRSATWCAAIFFSLAVATKITSVFGLTAAVIWLISEKGFRRAGACAAITALLVAVLVICFQYASHGRMLSIFRACASGGAGLEQIIQAPVVFSGIVCRFDPVTGAIWLVVIVAIFVTRQFNSLPAILLFVTTAGTVLIYGTPGTDVNHLIDLQTASVLCLGVCAKRDKKLLPVIAILALCAATLTVKEITRIRNEARIDQMSRALAIAGKSSRSGPILSENPLLPILADEHPYMLDCFMFRVFTEANPPLGDQLWDSLARQKFRAVILCPMGGSDEWKRPGNFGHEAIRHIESTYELAGHFGRYFVFLPRHSGPKAAPIP